MSCYAHFNYFVFVLFFQKFLLRSFICFLTPGSPQARGHLGASGNKERISRELKNAERGIRWSECIFADRTKDSGRAEKSRVALSRWCRFDISKKDKTCRIIHFICTFSLARPPSHDSWHLKLSRLLSIADSAVAEPKSNWLIVWRMFKVCA